ncbi:MAG: ABC transporter permease [Candidatus Bathyarchaeia archaeon]
MEARQVSEDREKLEARFREIRLTLQILSKNPLTIISLIILLLIFVFAVFAPWLAPYPDANLGIPHVEDRYKAPSFMHLFGTDYLGRDVFSLVIFGARISLSAGFTIVVLAVAIGWPLGVIAGYSHGKIDDFIMRICDMFLSFPSLVLAMVIAFVLGPSLINSMIAISVSWWPWYTRLARADAASLRERTFVEASKAVGLSDRTIMFRHILPNTMAPIIVQSTMDLGTAIIAEAGLSFLGLGAQPPTPEWGLMISAGRAVAFSAWWYATFPGIFIFLTAMAFNLLGDGLREALDPRLRRIRGD